MKKRIILLMISLCIGFSLCSCKSIDKPNISQKITMYLEGNSESWLKSHSFYTPLQAERITAFNNRLKELGIHDEIVIKYFPSNIDKNTFEKGAKTIDEIRKHDKDADIIDFDQSFVSQLEPIDSFLEDGASKDLRNEYPKNVLDLSKINGHYYYVPIVVYPFTVPSAQINKEYYDKHQKGINAAATSSKRLLEYFDQSYSSVENFILFRDVDFSSIISDKYQKIYMTPLFIRKSDGKVVNPYEEKYIVDMMRLLADIRYKGFTGKGLDDKKYENILNENHYIVDFSNMQTTKILNKFHDDVKNVDLGKEMYNGIGGLGILKSSKHKKEAFDILKIMNTDKKSASILQFGPNPQRNKDGKIIDNAHTTIGSFNFLGNNMIIESAENEIPDKAAFYKKMEESSNVDQSQLYPFNFNMKNMEVKVDDFNKIMNSSPNMDTNVLGNIAANLGDKNESAAVKPDEYMQEIAHINQKLKQAGIQDVINELQKQVDQWEKDENRNS